MSPKVNLKEEKEISAAPPEAPSSPSCSDPETAKRGQAIPQETLLSIDQTTDMAIMWEELLGLEYIQRTEEQGDKDMNDLHQVAQDMQAGRLGDPQIADGQLRTLAHQIGCREKRANSPLGMFLSEVGVMRNRTIKRIFRKGQ